MSQSRARKPHSIGVDTVSKGRSSMVKALGDSAPCAPHQSQPKEIQRSRSKNKIPKNIRYDLENALVGLCDVWFEDIKPHLVRNKIKLHVDTIGATPTPTASGDFGHPAATGCSHLDPGAASDRRQQTFVNSAGCCSTQHIASRAPCLRPLAPRLPPPPHPPPSPTLPHWTPQNKNSKSKSARRRRSRRKAQSPLSQTSNWRVPRLCRTYSLLSPQASPRTQTRRIQTATSVIHSKGSCLLSLVPRSRAQTRNKYSQTEIPYITKTYPYHLSPMKRTRGEPISSNTNQTQRNQHIINLMNPESGFPKHAVQPAQHSRVSEKRSKSTAYPPLRNLSPMKGQTTEFLRKTHCESTVEPMDVDSVPSKTNRNQSPRKRKRKDTASIEPVLANTQRHRRPENRPNTNSAPQQLHQTLEKRKVDPSIAPLARDKFEVNRTKPLIPLPQKNRSAFTQPNDHQFWRCFATTNLNPLKNKKQEIQNNERQSEIESSILFDKELVDIIGIKNDKSLRVLYKSPTREEFPSVMNLVPSPGSREKEIEININKKTLHWR